MAQTTAGAVRATKARRNPGRLAHAWLAQGVPLAVWDTYHADDGWEEDPLGALQSVAENGVPPAGVHLSVFRTDGKNPTAVERSVNNGHAALAGSQHLARSAAGETIFKAWELANDTPRANSTVPPDFMITVEAPCDGLPGGFIEVHREISESVQAFVGEYLLPAA